MSVTGNLLTNWLYGRRKWQWLFEKMHFISLYGMHTGGGSLYESSGETVLMEWLIDQKPADQKSFVWVDVGANDGGYSILMDKMVRQKGLEPKGFLFEPNSIHYDRLKKLSKDAGFSFFNCALGNKLGSADFFAMDTDTLSSLVDHSALYKGLQKESIQQVQVQTLDNMLATEKIEHIDFLKIDVEGFEYEVLQGALQQIIARRIDAIQFEFGRAQIVSRRFLFDFFELLTQGYTIHRVLKDGITPALHYNSRLEIFQTTNFVALKRK